MAKESKKLTLNEALQEASFFLQQADWRPDLARQYWMDLFDQDLTGLVKQLHQPLTQAQYDRYFEALERLVAGEPIQYIAGFAYFMDAKYRVSPACLIPREETQGLVERALANIPIDQVITVVDMGTGSGIIAIEIKKARPHARVIGVDLSPEALVIARENARFHGVEVEWLQSDFFKDLATDLLINVFVSNPPYIDQAELKLMDPWVLEHEPHLALFAEEQGLASYQVMSAYLPQYLHPSGAAFFEIGYSQGKIVKSIFQAAFPHAKVLVDQDYLGKDRYVSVLMTQEE